MRIQYGTYKRVGRELMYKVQCLNFIKIRLLHQTARQCIGIILSIKGAAAVVVRDDGRIIMVRQFRNSPDKETLEIPAG